MLGSAAAHLLGNVTVEDRVTGITAQQNAAHSDSGVKEKYRHSHGDNPAAIRPVQSRLTESGFVGPGVLLASKCHRPGRRRLVPQVMALPGGLSYFCFIIMIIMMMLVWNSVEFHWHCEPRSLSPRLR
eukprot:423662-Rhodomonas_salina.1